jgi:DNA/RNA-binding domain of Phe-tRNA-synthetase-like protein
MKFTIEKKIFEFFPSMRLAVVILKDLNNRFDRPEIQTELKKSWVSAGKAAAEYGNPQSHPRIKPWVDHFKELGVSRKQFPSSIESLVRRAGKVGESEEGLCQDVLAALAEGANKHFQMIPLTFIMDSDQPVIEF